MQLFLRGLIRGNTLDARQSSGVQVSDECQTVFQDLKLGKSECL